MPKIVRYALVTRQLPILPNGLHADGGGLYLQVAGIARTWVYRFQIAGRRRDMGLGPFPDISLAEARDKAQAVRKLALDGIDPIERRRTERAAIAVVLPTVPTFAQCVDRFLVKQAPEWSSARHADIWRRSVETDVLPVIGRLPIDKVDDRAVLDVLEPIWTVKPDTASRVRGRIESVLNWAKAAKLRTGENPARWRAHLSELLPKTSKIRKKKHFAALPYKELPALWPQLAAVDSIASRSLRFLILTAARTGEVLGARWGEIDMAERVWIIPADRMKSRATHRIPLSDDAMAILREMQTIGTTGLVFPGRGHDKTQTHSTLSTCLEKLRDGVTVHGFRSTFRDWAAEQTKFPREVAELALAHTIGNDTEAAYLRTDRLPERRELMAAWAAWCG